MTDAFTSSVTPLDGSVRSMGHEFNVLRNVDWIASNNAGLIVKPVQRELNGLGQLTGEGHALNSSVST